MLWSSCTDKKINCDAVTGPANTNQPTHNEESHPLSSCLTSHHTSYCLPPRTPPQLNHATSTQTRVANQQESSALSPTLRSDANSLSSPPVPPPLLRLTWSPPPPTPVLTDNTSTHTLRLLLKLWHNGLETHMAIKCRTQGEEMLICGRKRGEKMRVSASS